MEDCERLLTGRERKPTSKPSLCKSFILTHTNSLCNGIEAGSLQLTLVHPFSSELTPRSFHRKNPHRRTRRRRNFHMTCTYCRWGRTSGNCCGCGRKDMRNGESGIVGSCCGTGGSGGGAGGNELIIWFQIGIQIHLFLFVTRFLMLIRLLLGLFAPPSLLLFALPPLHHLCFTQSHFVSPFCSPPCPPGCPGEVLALMPIFFFFFCSRHSRHNNSRYDHSCSCAFFSLLLKHTVSK